MRPIKGVDPEEVIAHRGGSVLGKKTILKSDHFPGCQNKRLQIQVVGAPNYRKVGSFPVHGVAIPTVDGIRNVLDLIGATNNRQQKPVLWHSLREEPPQIDLLAVRQVTHFHWKLHQIAPWKVRLLVTLPSADEKLLLEREDQQATLGMEGFCWNEKIQQATLGMVLSYRPSQKLVNDMCLQSLEMSQTVLINNDCAEKFSLQ